MEKMSTIHDRMETEDGSVYDDIAGMSIEEMEYYFGDEDPALYL